MKERVQLHFHLYKKAYIILFSLIVLLSIIFFAIPFETEILIDAENGGCEEFKGELDSIVSELNDGHYDTGIYEKAKTEAWFDEDIHWYYIRYKDTLFNILRKNAYVSTLYPLIEKHYSDFSGCVVGWLSNVEGENGHFYDPWDTYGKLAQPWR